MTASNAPLKILVTGGAGYIGSHVVKHLCERGEEVTVYDNLSLGMRDNVDERAQFIEGDVRDETALKNVLSGFDVVYHFAAWKAAGESMDDPGKYADNNIGGTLTLLRAMDSCGVRNLVFSSSAAVYGSPKYLPLDEKHPKAPENYYGYTKLAIEENLAWFGKLKGLRSASLRYFNATGYDLAGKVRGKERSPANLSPVVMEVLDGSREKLKVFGSDYSTMDGTCIRDYIHVDDLSTAHLAAMDYILRTDESITVNLGTGTGASVLEVIKAAERASGKSVPFDLVARRPGDPAELVASSELALEKLGWKAEHSDLDTIFRSMCSVYLES